MSDEWVEKEWLKKSNRSVCSVFEETVEKYTDEEALVFGEQRLSYRELQERVNRFAKGLLKLGVKKGDHIALWMTNCPEFVYVQYASYKLGTVLIGVNTRFRVPEAEYVIKQSDSSTLIFEEQFLGKIDILSMVNQIVPEVSSCEPGRLVSEKMPMLKNVICLGASKRKGMYSFEEIMQLGDDPVMDKELEAHMAAVTPDDISHIMYTSGTTGFPKGVMLPQRNQLAGLSIEIGEEKLTSDSRVLGIGPMFTNMGGNGTLLKTFMVGGCVVIMQSFDPEEALRLIEKEKITSMLAIPTMGLMMVSHPKFKDYDLSSWKHVTFGGAPVPSTLVQDLKKAGVELIMNAYGLVEAMGMTSITPRSTPTELISATLGKPMPYCKVKIVDIQTGDELPPGKEGEICSDDSSVPGCHVSKGYYKMPEQTAETYKGGWVHSGDMGRLREGGYLELTGRVKDMMLVGGFNVYPAEIESVLYTHPKVEKVSVIGIPDPRLGEVPMAYVELKEGEQSTETEIIDFCKDKLANIKVPRYLKFVTEFPMTAAGKIQKFKLKEMATKELSLGK